jgi:hypothetical protein
MSKINKFELLKNLNYLWIKNKLRNCKNVVKEKPKKKTKSKANEKRKNRERKAKWANNADSYHAQGVWCAW